MKGRDSLLENHNKNDEIKEEKYGELWFLNNVST